VSRLNGEVSIDTTPGVGTRFTLRVPLTVTMADTLLVRAADETFAIPMSAVKVVLEVPTLDGDTLVVDGEPLPVIPLGPTLGLPPGDRGGRLPVVVVRTGRATFALAVDAVAGQDEVVVQTVAAFLDGEGPFSGAAIAADGAVIMIVDPARLLEESRGVTRGVFAASPAPVVPTAHRVLLVDDSVTAREFVAEVLERAGFHVTVARDGAEALEMLAADPVDLVITDLDMPRLDGYQLVRDLRGTVATRDVPIVVVSTRAGAKDAELAHELGVQHYVTKPVDPERFVHLIESLVDGQTAAR
jgi:CheY-like chemotaxis protein/chemotaxis signal transduction protein